MWTQSKNERSTQWSNWKSIDSLCPKVQSKKKILTNWIELSKCALRKSVIQRNQPTRLYSIARQLMLPLRKLHKQPSKLVQSGAQQAHRFQGQNRLKSSIKMLLKSLKHKMRAKRLAWVTVNGIKLCKQTLTNISLRSSKGLAKYSNRDSNWVKNCRSKFLPRKSSNSNWKMLIVTAILRASKWWIKEWHRPRWIENTWSSQLGKQSTMEKTMKFLIKKSLKHFSKGKRRP